MRSVGKKIAITGSSSTMAKLLLKELSEDDEIDEIKGLDIQNSDLTHEKFTFLKGDIREREDLKKLVSDVDIVIHMAFILFSYPKNQKHREEIDKINVEGSKNVFQVAADGGVKKIIYISSVAGYGFHYDRDVIQDPLQESDEMSGVTKDNFYLEHKNQVELYLNEFQDTYPDIVVSRLRPHLLAGPQYLELVNLKPYKDGLSGKLYTRIKQPDIKSPPTEQLVHEDDVIAGIRYCIDHDFDGAINIAGDPLNLDTYLSEKSIRLLHVPLWFARFALWFKALFSEVGRLERYWTPVMQYPIIVSNQKYKELVGEPVTTREIFDEMYEYLNAG